VKTVPVSGKTRPGADARRDTGIFQRTKKSLNGAPIPFRFAFSSRRLGSVTQKAHGVTQTTHCMTKKAECDSKAHLID
jgi:hypothetical protein